MRSTHPYIYLILSLTMMAACTGPVIIEGEEDTNGTGNGNNPPTRDSVAILHEGSYESPYSIGEAQTLRRGKHVWIEGYIVGCVKGSMENGCNYTTEANTSSNILLADTFPTGKEYDYLYCLPIELPNNSIERDELNLYDNPDNYHRKLCILGDLTLYFSVVGLKNIEGYTLTSNDNNDEEIEEPENPEEPDKPNEPDDPNSTRGDTLSIAEGIKLQGSGEQVYIKGYIIGYTTTNKKIYYDLENIKNIKVTTAQTNVILADSIEERDNARVIAVELSKGSYIQKAINLYDNPQNLHRQLTVKGTMKEYRSLNGCINIPNGLLQIDGSTDEDYYFRLE